MGMDTVGAQTRTHTRCNLSARIFYLLPFLSLSLTRTHKQAREQELLPDTRMRKIVGPYLKCHDEKLTDPLPVNIDHRKEAKLRTIMDRQGQG